MLIGGFAHVPRPGIGVVDAQQNAVVGPTQIGTRRVPIRKSLIEQAHVVQVASIKALAELLPKALGKLSQQGLPVLGTRTAALLEFYDVAPDLPVGLDHDGIDRVLCLATRLLQNGTNLVIQRVGGL
ncbi:hypothetical protein D3C87_1638990 [compost metagenome]